MKAFTYERPTTPAAAVAALTRIPGAKFIAVNLRPAANRLPRHRLQDAPQIPGQQWRDRLHGDRGAARQALAS